MYKVTRATIYKGQILKRGDVIENDVAKKIGSFSCEVIPGTEEETVAVTPKAETRVTRRTSKSASKGNAKKGKGVVSAPHDKMVRSSKTK